MRHRSVAKRRSFRSLPGTAPGQPEPASPAVLGASRAAPRNLPRVNRHGVFLDAELLCEEPSVIQGTDDLLVHANHLEAPKFQMYEISSENSCQRRRCLQELQENYPLTLAVGDIRGLYRAVEAFEHDHGCGLGMPWSLCDG